MPKLRMPASPRTRVISTAAPRAQNPWPRSSAQISKNPSSGMLQRSWKFSSSGPITVTEAK